ncbi:uncharacterized protein TNCV_1656451 [Trichonephila clavipes]|nr:uncharacterized protein TNCV_1656451 [Trichonephila clavipes]
MPYVDEKRPFQDMVENLCKYGNETIIYETPSDGIGTLKVTTHPPYKPNKNCTIIIKPPSDRGIVLSVRKVDFRERRFFCLDYLKVFHSDLFTSPSTICRFQFDLEEKVSFYQKGPMTLVYHTEGAEYPKFSFEEGFTLTFTVVSEEPLKKGHSPARKLCSAINVNFSSKTAFRCLEKKLEHVSNNFACKVMNQAASEVHKKNNFDEVFQCGVSVDGTWQCREHLFLNGCVGVISIDTGKALDIEVMSKMCRLCSKKTEDSISLECEKHVGSSGVIGVYRIFQRY